MRAEEGDGDHEIPRCENQQRLEDLRPRAQVSRRWALSDLLAEARAQDERMMLACLHPLQRWWRAHVVVLVSLLLLTSTMATSADAQSRDDFLRRVDTDGDGRVSLAEYQFHLSFAFRQMDIDHDDVLEATEQLVPNAKPLTRAELDARLAAQFKRQDRNHDGYLNAAELSAPPAP